jgi:pimeloyl-ACP methyl ester carboxylesterase
MAWASLNGIEIWYEMRGDGPDVLLIPGRGLDGGSWAPQLDCYCAHFRVITYDPRGVGKTKTTQDQFDIRQMAKDAEALLDALAVTSAHIAGFSLGGMAAIHLAASSDIEIRSLALHSTAHRSYPHLFWRRQLLLLAMDTDRAELWATLSAFTGMGAEFINANEKVFAADVERRRASWERMTPAEKAGLRSQIHAAMGHESDDILALIDAPTLVTVGSSDEVTRPEYARDIAGKIPNAQFVLIPGAPHRSPLYAKDEFNRVSLAFMLEQERNLAAQR